MEEGVQSFTTLLWPSGNDTFRETVLEYSKVMADLDEVVMRMVCEVYGITNSYEPLRQTTSYLLRLIKYRAPAKHETSLGIVSHTDKSFMSILHQRHVKGLQIMAKNGDWITVDPSPSAFIVMAGDAWMDEWKNRTLSKIVEVPEELADDEHPLKFKPLVHVDLLNILEDLCGV
ncbi:hypothetical protein C2S52_001065 [Perilla frutescens var. hirtella]|nr:hypothetical protein C2S52_001065 [Perilla frutescens var. hirtella]